MLRLALLAAVVAALAVPALGAGAVAGQGGWGFATPSRNIVCNSASPGTVRVDCAVLSATSPTKGQKDWSLPARGRPWVHYIMANIGTDVPVLAYGRTWKRGPFTCVSRRTGLTCRNAGGHGFALSRERQRVF
jgi:hypothetical protein